MAQMYKGVRIQQTLRIPVDLHRLTVTEAGRDGRTFNDVVVKALRAYHGTDAGVGERQNLKVYNAQGDAIGAV